jgi:hypothetical protein
MTSRPSPEAPAPGRGLLPWLALFALTALLTLIIRYVAPLGLRLPGYRQMDRFIADNDLKATAIYYSDLEEFAREQGAVRDSLRYAPVDSAKSSRPAAP